MKLFFAAASPFVRKVVMVAKEAGLDGRLERVDAATSPINPNAELAKANPVKKIPALALDDGSVLFDSPVICEYLDSLHGGAKMFPSGPARWEALRLQAGADGLMDAAVAARYETALRPEDKRWPEWVDGQLGKIDGALDDFEARAGSFGDRVDIGTIGVACARGHLDFRYAHRAWRPGRPKLVAWFEAFGKRPSFQQSKPPA